jgi:hypothetical protein
MAAPQGNANGIDQRTGNTRQPLSTKQTLRKLVLFAVLQAAVPLAMQRLVASSTLVQRILPHSLSKDVAAAIVGVLSGIAVSAAYAISAAREPQHNDQPSPDHQRLGTTLTNEEIESKQSASQNESEERGSASKGKRYRNSRKQK